MVLSVSGQRIPGSLREVPYQDALMILNIEGFIVRADIKRHESDLDMALAERLESSIDE